MLDVCLACRIQAPHRQGRSACPRCGGPLTLLDDQGNAVSQPQPAPRRPPRPQRPRPVQSRPALRWTADRPVEARPMRRPPTHATPQARRPAYRAIPRWGLLDPPPEAVADDAAAPNVSERLSRTLSLVWYVLAAAAVVHLIRYLIAVVNRSTPIPVWIDLLSGSAVLVFGTFAFVGMILGLLAVVRWLIGTREQAYRDADLRDPRTRRQQIVLSALPLANVVGAPVLLTEAAQCGADPDAAVDRIRRIAIAWGLVNGVALIAVGYRIAAWFSDSVQVQADALALVTISLAVSAVFTRWAVPRLPAVLTGPVREDETPRRLVAA